MKVTWAESAIGHLADVYGYIARDSEQYALRMVDRITSRSTQIGDFPESGEVVPEYGNPAIREVIEGPYRIVYRGDADQVVVLAVIHAARLMPPSLPEKGT